jgi:hypothetical protein
MRRLVCVLLLVCAHAAAERPDLQAIDDEELAESRLGSGLAVTSDTPDPSDVEAQQRLLPSEQQPAGPMLIFPQSTLPAHDPSQFARDLNTTINPPTP